MIGSICELFSKKPHHNCLTWAREKLKIAGIYDDLDGVFSPIAAVPVQEIGNTCIIS